MKTLIVLMSFFASVTWAKNSAWNADSCNENLIRQFSCEIEGKTVDFDLEGDDVQMENFETEDNPDKIYGIYVSQHGKDLYIACSSSGTLERVLLRSLAKWIEISCTPSEE